MPADPGHRARQAPGRHRRAPVRRVDASPARRTVQRMLLETLAKHPDTCPHVLSRLTEDALTSARGNRWTLARALVSNPSVGWPTCAALLTAHRDIATTLFARPDMDAQTAITLLGPHPVVDVARAALRLVPDPTGALREHVLAARDDSILLRSDVLRDADADPQARVDAARALVGHRQMTDADARHVERLVRTVTVTDPKAGADLAADLIDRARTSGPVARMLIDDLATVAITPEAGSGRWFTDPGTATADVIAWATAAGTATAWTAALRDHDDPSGTVARAALGAARRPQRWPLERIARTGHLPARLRQSAAHRLTGAGWDQWADYPEVPSLLAGADLTFVRWFLGRYPTGAAALGAVQARTDLDPPTIAALDAARTAYRQRSTGRTPALMDATHTDWLWHMWLLTHPGTGGDLRARAAADVCKVAGTGSCPPWAGTLAGHLCAAAGDPRAVADVLPVDFATVAGGALTRTPAGAAVAHAAVHNVARAVRGPGAATALVALAEEFTGTHAELVATVGALTGA